MVYTIAMQFTDLNLISPLLQAIKEAGYTQPSPIQKEAIPPVLAGRDLLGCAQTGTGKTAAFALPILQRLHQNPAPAGKKRPIRALVLTPTRELALQIGESFEAYARHLALRSAVIFGGVGQGPQVAQLQRGVDILVATPGRLNDLIGQGYVKLDALTVFVLDEADRMLDMGFVQDVKKVIKILPKIRQTLLFSATMPDEIVKLADSLLHQPAKVFVTPPATTVEKIEQCLYKVDKANKRHLLASLLRGGGVDSALVFTRTKHGADRVVRELKREGIEALAIHGNKSQNARQSALGRFKDGRVQVLIATDIAARGLDISELSHVFNYDLPNIPETYVHRIGRTGRAGRGGAAVSFCCVEELPYLADIEKLIGFRIPEEKKHPWPMQVLEVPEKPVQGGQKPPKPPKGKASIAKMAADKAVDLVISSKNKNKQEQRKAKAPADAPRDAEPRPRPEKEAAKNAPAAPARGKSKNAPPKADNPYDNRGGGRAIITKRPVWALEASAQPVQGENDMSRNNRRRRGKGHGAQNNPQPESAPQPKGQARRPAAAAKNAPIPKNERGVFDFSEEELAEDQSLRLISPTSGENKYASFEDYLKDH